GKRSQRPILNNGEIVFTYKEASKLELRPDQFRDALDSLIEKGFIEITHQGAGQGDPTLYYLSSRWEKWPTEDFDPVPPGCRRRKNTSGRSGWTVYHKRQKSATEKRITISTEKRITKGNLADLSYGKQYHNKDRRYSLTE
ncbi:MAG: hypothetical protein V3U24_05385, partial [Candidatus Neomarinimicrobiota bacterium]